MGRHFGWGPKRKLFLRPRWFLAESCYGYVFGQERWFVQEAGAFAILLLHADTVRVKQDFIDEIRLGLCGDRWIDLILQQDLVSDLFCEDPVNILAVQAPC